MTPQSSPQPTAESEPRAIESVMFGAGCFWGIEVAFRKIDGVLDAEVGYSGGHTENPTYEEVCTGRTGHAEVVNVQFDPAKVTFAQLLDVFWTIHDPTQVNRQGPDIGTQYRSAIFFTSESQQLQAEEAKARLNESGRFRRPIATQIEPAKPFYRAEEYHQRYLEKRGMTSCGVSF